MAFVKWMKGIEFVSGALSKINKKSQHAADQTMLLATHREAPTTSTKCTRLYARGLESVTRKTPVGQDEMAARNSFKAVAQGVALRRKDINKVATDIAAFNAQKDSPNGYKTLRQYLWHVVSAELNG